MNEEKRAELDRLLVQSESLIAEFFNNAPEPEGDLEDLLADSRAEAAARFDPSLLGLRNSQYIVRIRRDDQDDLSIDGPSVRDVMRGIEDEVYAAAPKMHEEARIELDSLSRGSVVLHYRAVRPLATVNDGEFDHGLSIVDSAIDRVTKLHRAIEGRRPPGEIAKIAGSSGLLRASRSLLEGLDKHELNIATRWRNAKGDRVAGQLTRVAKEYAAELFERMPKDTNLPVSGRVISLGLDGRFVLHASKRRYEVGPSQLGASLWENGNLVLGETIHVLLEQEVGEDRVGLSSEPKFKLIGMDERLEP